MAISPKLPMTKDSKYGFALNETYQESIAQNLKYLILTNPGERVMDPNFGVGIRNFLFEPSLGIFDSDIRERILEQTYKYIPFIKIENIIINDDEKNVYKKNVKISYFIIALGVSDTLDLSVFNN